jgi:hypothetical protein
MQQGVGDVGGHVGVAGVEVTGEGGSITWVDQTRGVQGCGAVGGGYGGDVVVGRQQVTRPIRNREAPVAMPQLA